MTRTIRYWTLNSGPGRVTIFFSQQKDYQHMLSVFEASKIKILIKDLDKAMIEVSVAGTTEAFIKMNLL